MQTTSQKVQTELLHDLSALIMKWHTYEKDSHVKSAVSTRVSKALEEIGSTWHGLFLRQDRMESHKEGDEWSPWAGPSRCKNNHLTWKGPSGKSCTELGAAKYLCYSAGAGGLLGKDVCPQCGQCSVSR